MSKSCSACVNFLPNAPTTGLPGCKAFGYVLGTSPKNATAGNVRAQEAFAGSCPSFNVSQEAPVGVAGLIGTVKTEAIVSIASKVHRQPVTDCGDCEHFIQPARTQAETGFTSGSCGAHAVLVNVTQRRNLAKTCIYSNEGANSENQPSKFIDVYPEYGGKTSRRAAGKKAALEIGYHLKCDPREWPTDAPVLDEDKSFGIRAWRRVEDPKGYGQPVLVPIFDWKLLGLPEDPRESYGDHKPHLYVDHAGLLYSFAALYMGGLTESDALNKTLALIGDAGTGKTEFWCYVAYLMDLPFTRLSLRPSTDAIDFFGETHLTKVELPDGKAEVITEWRPGSFTAAYQKPGIMCLDEPNSAPDDVWFLLRPVLDNAGQLRMDSQNLRFSKEPRCFIGLAMNPSYKPIYRGTRDLSDADLSRIIKFELSLPNAETERKIVTQHCKEVGYDLPVAVLDKLMAIGGQLRSMAEDGSLQMSWGIRSVVAVAQLTWFFSLEDAFRRAVLDGLEPSQRDLIMTVVRAYA
jgi:MoxR-like ATPase